MADTAVMTAQQRVAVLEAQLEEAKKQAEIERLQAGITVAALVAWLQTLPQEAPLGYIDFDGNIAPWRQVANIHHLYFDEHAGALFIAEQPAYAIAKKRDE